MIQFVEFEQNIILTRVKFVQQRVMALNIVGHGGASKDANLVRESAPVAGVVSAAGQVTIGVARHSW